MRHARRSLVVAATVIIAMAGALLRSRVSEQQRTPRARSLTGLLEAETHFLSQALALGGGAHSIAKHHEGGAAMRGGDYDVEREARANHANASEAGPPRPLSDYDFTRTANGSLEWAWETTVSGANSSTAWLPSDRRFPDGGGVPLPRTTSFFGEPPFTHDGLVVVLHCGAKGRDPWVREAHVGWLRGVRHVLAR